MHRAPEEIPGVGTFAVVADPQGAIFTLFQPPAGVTRPEQPATSTPGMPVWHELVAGDPESAFQFYAGLFGWTKAHVIDMGPNSIYQIFAAGSQPIGGMVAPANPAQGEGWLFYFQVDEIDAAIERVKQNGGNSCFTGLRMCPAARRLRIAATRRARFLAWWGRRGNKNGCIRKLSPDHSVSVV